MYSEAERQIYTPIVNGRQRRYDPLAIRRRLLVESDGQFEAIRTEYEAEDEVQSARAEETLLRIARAAFSFRPISDAEHADEVNDADTLEVLYDWLDWMGKPLPKDATLPSSSPPSAASPG